MLNVVKQCVRWLDWRFVAGGLAVVVGLAVCDKLPTLRIFAGATPLLLIAVCVVPCLLSLGLLRRASRGQRTTEQVPGHTHEG